MEKIFNDFIQDNSLSKTIKFNGIDIALLQLLITIPLNIKKNKII